MIDPADYAGWYATARGRWIGETEYALLQQLAEMRGDDAVLDVGCGTGYFTDCLARRQGGLTVGLDPNLDWLNHAARHARRGISWIAGRAEALPFADRSFDIVISVTALCFIADQRAALREMLRVCRRRMVLGLLNRHSVLWHQKGRGGGTGAYMGAYWHGVQEARGLLRELGCNRVRARTAVFCPGAQPMARWLEAHLSNRLPWGAFLVVVGDLADRVPEDAPYDETFMEPETPWPSQRI